jgi:hypothetical protein
MVAFEGNGQCREAQLHYHDFLEDRGIVPKSVAEHIDECAHCRAQVQRLGQVLGEAVRAGNPHRSNHSRELIAELQTHFEHVGEQVTCSQVRRFLPGLLADRIRVPTPVTVHVDQCDQCTEDLERLRSLGLTQEQLARLEELYAEPVQVNLSLCRQVKVMLAERDDLRLEEIPAHVADHICSCPLCRGRVYEARQDLLDRCQKQPAANPYVGCGRIMPADLFGFVVLHNMEASDSASTVQWRRVVADHVFSCSKCLAKVQNMHRILYGVAERADSGVATVYTTGIVPPPSKKARNSYAAYPIDVHVVGGQLRTTSRRPRQTGALATMLKQRLRGRKLKSYVPATALTLVVALLVGIYVISSQSASGLNVGQVNDKISRMPNIHIIYLAKDGVRRTNEIWASKRFGLLAQVTPEWQTVQYTHGRRPITVTSGGSQVQRKDMNAEELAKATKDIQTWLGVQLPGVSLDAELRHQDGDVDGVEAGVEVYEILPQVTGDGEESRNHRLLYVDSAGLLKKTKCTTDGPVLLTTTTLYEYPSDEEVRQHFPGITSQN